MRNTFLKVLGGQKFACFFKIRAWKPFLLCPDMALNNCDVKVTQKQFNDAFEENCCHNQKFSIAAFERFDESKVKSEFKFLYYDCDENNDYPAYDCFQHQ